MASNTPFQLEDNLDEDFFDNLVNDDDDDYIVSSSPAPVLADEIDTQEAKALAKLSIGEVTAETISNDVKPVSIDASAQNSYSLASVDSFQFDSIIESDNVIVQHEVLPATEIVESAPDSTISDPKTTSDEVAFGAEEAVSAQVASGSLEKEGSGSASLGPKEVQWSSFNDAVHDNGFGSYDDLFGGFDDNGVQQLQNIGSNLNNESNVQSENNHNYGGSVELSTVDQGQNTNWEDLYPGWKYDSVTGQWYQVDSQDPTADWTAEDKSEVSYLQQTTQSVPETITESGKAEVFTNWNQISQANDTLESVSNWNETPQENNGYPSNMVFDPQYPGWYFDTISQEWLSLDAYNLSLQTTVQSQDHVDQNGFSSTVNSLENEQKYTQINEAYNNDGSSTNFNQQGRTMWQQESAAPVAANSKLGQSQQIEYNYSQDFPVGNQFSQQKSYNYEKENQGYSGFSANSVSLGFVPQSNQPIIEQKQGYNFTQQQQIQSENSSNYLQKQQIQNVSQFSYSPTAGRSSFGRPPHALVSFGFGGKLIVMKDNTTSLKTSSYGTQEPADNSISVLSLTEVLNVKSDASRFGVGPCDYFRTLCQLSFPGPLTSGNVGVKELNKWIDERISNSESSDIDYRQSEVLSLLMSLLKIACQHYGKLRSPFGTDTTLKESDVPEAAVAKLFASVKRKNDGQFSEYGASAANCLQKLPPEGQMLATAAEVQTLLVSGSKKEALHCAQQGQLWGPALVLAAQLGDQYYVETVKQMALRQLVAGTPLRTLCLLIAGQPADVFSTEAASDTTTLYTSPNISQQPAQLGANGMLDDWEENLAVITANRTKDDELVLIHLGDCLWKERSEIIAAHICYLVAEANIEPYSDTARLCLVGADHWKYPRTYASPQAIQRTEIYEYSKVLGNSQFMLLPFQPYKIIYAHMLAELGRVSDSLKYCQAVSRTLKTGRAPEVETWRQLVSSLEERIKTHQQGGFSTNLAPAKLVGKLLNLFDSTAHRVVGGLPPPVPHSSQVNEQYNQSMGPRVSTSQSTMAMSSLIPSASTEPITDWTPDRMTMQNRSVSEPNFVRNPTQDRQVDSSKETTTTSSFFPDNKNNNNTVKSKASAPTSRFGRFSFGTQLLQKTVGLVMKPRQDKQAKLGDSNKFYYDEKLKRWVEEGVDPPAEEAALPPPPTAAAFPTTMTSSYSSDFSANNTFGSNGSMNSPPAEYNNNNYSYNSKLQNSPPSSGYGSSGIPPIPPSSNQFSARGRVGVRSRYVDTFNQGGGNPTNLFQPPAASSLTATTPTAGPKFFVPTPSSSSPSVEHTIDPTVTQNEQITETPSIPTMNNSYQSPSPPPPMTMQRFASMDNMTRRINTNNSSGSLSTHSRRTASWSGTAGDAFTSPTPPKSGLSALPHSSVNGGSYSDDLDEVEL
jgi:hypothetical protein